MHLPLSTHVMACRESIRYDYRGVLLPGVCCECSAAGWPGRGQSGQGNQGACPDSEPEQGGLWAARRTCGIDPWSARSVAEIQGHRGPWHVETNRGSGQLFVGHARSSNSVGRGAARTVSARVTIPPKSCARCSRLWNFVLPTWRHSPPSSMVIKPHVTFWSSRLQMLFSCRYIHTILLLQVYNS